MTFARYNILHVPKFVRTERANTARVCLELHSASDRNTEWRAPRSPSARCNSNQYSACQLHTMEFRVVPQNIGGRETVSRFAMTFFST